MIDNNYRFYYCLTFVMAKHLHYSGDLISNQTKLFAVAAVLGIHAIAGFVFVQMDIKQLEPPKKITPIQISFVEPVTKAAPVIDSVQAYTTDSASDVAAAAMTPKHAAKAQHIPKSGAPKNSEPTIKQPIIQPPPNNTPPKTDTSKSNAPKSDTVKMDVPNHTQTPSFSQSNTSQLTVPPLMDDVSSKTPPANAPTGDDAKNANNKSNANSKNNADSPSGAQYGKNSNQSNEGAGNKSDSKSGNKDNGGSSQGGGQKPPAGADGNANKPAGAKNLDNVQLSAGEVSWVNKPSLSYDADMYSPKHKQVLVTYKVNKNGGVESVSFSTGDKDLDRLLRNQLKKAKFKPFIREGQAVSGTVTVSFQL